RRQRPARDSRQPSQVKIRYLSQPRQVDPGIGPGGIGASVAEMVADLLQAQPLSKEVRRASVAKTMGAVRCSLDAQCVQSAADHVMKAAWRKASKRGLERHKQISRGATPGPGPLEIV